jgi:hypothetical protein
MRKNNCELIRRELDELMLDEAYSSSAVEHLRECAECREFHEKQTKLRQIVGSLGTVAAPPDFDFRLRARLANESSRGAQFHYWPLARRGLAMAVLLLLFATGAVLVWNAMNHPSTSDNMANKDEVKVQTPEKPVETVTPGLPVKQDKNVVAGGGPEKRREIQNERQTTAGLKTKRPLVAVDSASLGAEVIKGLEPASDVFPIDVSSQSIRVSVNDGRGNARTISVPPISFGSQRIVQNANQFAPKRAW